MMGGEENSEELCPVWAGLHCPPALTCSEFLSNPDVTVQSSPSELEPRTVYKCKTKRKVKYIDSKF